ncbi:RagB/SusD family nutrient uptake outer membrane protein [Arcticibacter eurypsychrophilus]|uniref:RagB/SusD family nutrient uptake outer membrane protein n=1 Tax=Arcticibacter eurypsychrophilus TaxID=1434752 RepID=UPI00084D43AE|nr:RagB/SusD family nutrient uptake outer membrane protein [Arcticibacter eurypsychrophilus]
MKIRNTLIIKVKNNIRRILYSSLIVGLILTLPSCKKYLDIVPDNVATIDNAFTMRTEAEKYLFTCYSFLPKDGDPLYNVGLLAGDELWIPTQEWELLSYGWRMARGGQSAANPYLNAWNGNYQGGGSGDLYGLYKGIRNCNIFLENVQDESKVLDLRADERLRWIAEVKFLKAYYHFYLLRMYGPIPLVDKNVDVSATEEEVRVKRMPFDDCVIYISTLLDEAVVDLPSIIVDRNSELGRITKPIALAIKAKLLLLAASPLFNGNSDYAGFKDKDGVDLFNPTYDAGKWKSAADAAKVAIDASETAGFSLYVFPGTTFKLSDTTLLQLKLRGAMTDPWNSEHVWANPNSRADFMQRVAMPKLVSTGGSGDARMQLAAPLKIAEMFYSSNGVPINEDKDIDFSNKYSLRTANTSERFYVKDGYQTARLNFDREPRFYADLSFDGGIWYKYDSPTNSDEGTYSIEGKYTQLGGATHVGFYNETGYYIKKLVDWNMANSSSGVTYQTYPWPQVRLSDIYLMYAEALNESDGPGEEVYEYVNKIRRRADLQNLQDAWTAHSTNPTKFTTKEGMREIIHQERGIELAFEGNRFWDILRWKKAADSFNQPITGWSVFQQATTDYYRVRTIYSQNFVAPRDYLWPIRTYDLTVNPNLIQNPGW